MNYRTILIDMPLSIKGMIGYDAVDDFYTIYINARHSQAQQLKSYLHELGHINRDDLHSELLSDINVLEKKAH